MLFKILVYPLAMGDFHRHSHILERQFYCPIANRSTPFLHFSNNFSSPTPRRARKARRQHKIRKPKHETSPNDRNHNPERAYLIAPLDSARGRLRSRDGGRPWKGRCKPKMPYLVARRWSLAESWQTPGLRRNRLRDSRLRALDLFRISCFAFRVCGAPPRPREIRDTPLPHPSHPSHPAISG